MYVNEKTDVITANYFLKFYLTIVHTRSHTITIYLWCKCITLYGVNVYCSYLFFLYI